MKAGVSDQALFETRLQDSLHCLLGLLLFYKVLIDNQDQFFFSRFVSI